MGSSVIDNKKRLKEIIQEAKADIKSGLEANGNTTAVERGLSYLSEGSYYQAQVSSVGFYRFLDDLYKRYDDCADRLIDILSGLVQLIFNKNKMLINITAEGEGYDLIKDELLHCPMLNKDNVRLRFLKQLLTCQKSLESIMKDLRRRVKCSMLRVWVISKSMVMITPEAFRC